MTPKLGYFLGLLIFEAVKFIVFIADTVITYGYVVGTGKSVKFFKDHGAWMTFLMLLDTLFICNWFIRAEAQKRPRFLIPWAILLMLNTLFYVLHFVGAIVKDEGLQVWRSCLYSAHVVANFVYIFYWYKEPKMESGAMGGVPVMFVNKK